MVDYFNACPPRSHKLKRIFLVDHYFELLGLEAYEVTSPYYKVWCDFLTKWKYGIKDKEK